MTMLHMVRGCQGDRCQTRLFSPWIQLCLKLLPRCSQVGASKFRLC